DRAAMYLAEPEMSPIVWSDGIGSLEGRGGAWLLIKYLVNRYGLHVLSDMIRSTQSGTANIATQMATSWTTLLNNWAITLYMDHNPEFANLNLGPNYSFGGADLRT